MEPTAYESPAEPGGRDGDLHRQEQATPEAGVAEDGRSDRGPGESIQDRAYADSFVTERAQASPHDQQAFSAGDDAGAAARLQPDLHRVRPHSGIRRQH